MPMLPKPAKKYCQTCGEELQGRSDKKFCDDHCRTTFNNQFKIEPEVVKEINQHLKKNRKILEELVPEDTGKIKVTYQKLVDKGYNFMYHTHQYKTKIGNLYTFVYDYAWMKLDDQFYMLVKRQGD